MKTRSTQQLVLAAALATVSATTLAQSFTIEGQPISELAFLTNTLATGDEPADMNGDGLADVTYYLNGAFRVMRGDTSGEFGQPVASFIPSGFTIALSDANADGRDDYWSLSSDRLTVTAHLSQFNAKLGTSVATALNYPANEVLVKDLDGDGIPDLAANQIDGPRVTIFKGQGDGSMVFDREMIVDLYQPTHLAGGDVNGDGHDDLIVLTVLFSNFSSLWVSFGSPTGFGSPALISADAGAWSIFSVVDVVGDDADDILLEPSGYGGDVATLIMEGSSTIANGATEIPLLSGRASSVATADIDTNGLIDLLFIRGDSDAIDVWLQTSDGALERSTSISCPTHIDQIEFISDVSRDGILDLVYKREDKVVVRRGTVAESFGFAIPAAFGFGVGDFDGDGLSDVASAEMIGESRQLVHYRGLVGDAFERRESLLLDDLPRATEVADVDGDGDLDVLVVSDSIAAYLNDGGTLSAPIMTPITGPGRAHIGDFSGDGIPDVVTVDEDAIRFDGLGDGSFVQTAVTLNILPAGLVAHEESGVGDADQDGVLDVIVTGKFDTVAITQQGIVDLGDGANGDILALTDVALGDLENDGVLELFLPAKHEITAQRGVQVRRPNASGEFVDAFFVVTDDFQQKLELADLDGDGDDDLIITSDSGMRVGIDDGMGGVTLTAQVDLGTRINSARIADMDGDGLVDAVVGLKDDVRVLKNAASVWWPLGESLAGSAGLSRLTGTGPLTSNGDIALLVHGSLPSAATTLVVGLLQLSLPYKGGVLVPSPDILITGLATDGTGGLTLPGSLPDDMPPGIDLFFQAWQVEGSGFAATSAVRGTTY